MLLDSIEPKAFITRLEQFKLNLINFSSLIKEDCSCEKNLCLVRFTSIYNVIVVPIH